MKTVPLLLMILLLAGVLPGRGEEFAVWRGSQPPGESGWTPHIQIPGGPTVVEEIFQVGGEGDTGVFHLERADAFMGSGYFTNEQITFPSAGWTVEIKASVEAVASPPNFTLLRIIASTGEGQFGVVYLQTDSHGMVRAVGREDSAVDVAQMGEPVYIRLLGKGGAVEVRSADDTVIGEIVPDSTPTGPALAFGDISRSDLEYLHFKSGTQAIYDWIAWDATGTYGFKDRPLPSSR